MRTISLKLMMIMIIACFLVVTIPVPAARTAEESVGDSLTRGSRFTVTITGLPRTPYYIWIPHTSSMTGEPYDQPPVIASSQTNVEMDPPGGPWPIGSYQYNNGGGQTIRDDIPPSTPEMPNTWYYALVTTDTTGQATVEFRTSINTGLRSYSVRVENPRSVDSDNLQVDLRVYSRRAPSIGIFTSAPTTVVTTTTTIPVTVTTPPQTTLPLITLTSAPEPVKTTIPAQTPPLKVPAGLSTAILAAGAGLLLIRRT